MSNMDSSTYKSFSTFGPGQVFDESTLGLFLARVAQVEHRGKPGGVRSIRAARILFPPPSLISPKKRALPGDPL